MKKYILFFVLTVLMIMTSVVTYATDESVSAILNKEISIMYNNELKEFSDVNGTKVDPISYNFTTYLPVRAISALFDIPVDWDGENNKVLVGKGSVVTSTVKSVDDFKKGNNEEIKLTLSKSLKVDYKDEIQTFKDANGNIVYPLSYNGTTYLPVRAISNMYGASIEWNEENQRITLVKEDKIAKITDVIIKVIDDTLCTEIKTDAPISSYTNHLIAEGTVTAEPYLNVRANTNTGAEIIETIPKGTLVSVKEMINAGRNSTWYKITYNEKTGYVSADYVDVATVRLFIDLDKSVFATDTSSKDINYDNIKSIRFGKQLNDTNRIVLDLNKVTEYSIFQSDDKLTTYMALAKNFEFKEEKDKKDYVLVASIGNQIFLPDIEKDPENSNEEQDKSEDVVTPSGDFNVESGEVSGEINQNNEKTEEKVEEKIEENKEELTEEQKEKMAKVTSIVYSSSTDKTKINITGKYTYEKFMLENPTRLVIDIKDCLLEVDGPKEITPKNKNIEEVRFSQNEKDKVRIVFQLSKVADYEITKKTKGLEVEIEEPEYRNIEYVTYKDYAELILKDVKQKVFDTSESSRNNKYTITYSSSKFDSGKSTLEFNDEFVNKIEIRTNKITITGSGKMKYSMSQDGSDVIVRISEKAEIKEEKADGDFIILLDAGHGGKDPGACHNGGKTLAEQEKTYTLKIMLKLMELLEDTKGITVRTSRTEDVYIDREGRIEYVLDNPDADMLVSIHINSMANSSYKGTMVLYYNKQGEKEDYNITSKEIALLVKDNLVEDLDLVDRGVVSRPDLWVLEQNAAGKISEIVNEERPVTNLPAILCELCFISNEEDFARLQTEEFQDGAALAIYNGIIAAKEQMGK